MPFGLWKSKWEIHGENLDQYHEDSERRQAEYHEELRELRKESQDLRADYVREISETRLFNRELLIRMEKTYANLGETLEYVGEALVGLRREVREMKGAVDAQTDAILRLLDRFEDPGGRPPV
jgi:chromosome segregation ATPase